VAGTVKNTRGGIGYVENAYATQNKLTTTELRNKAGKFVDPTLASFEAAASSADWNGAPDYAVSLIDQPGDTSWPIVSATFLLLPKDPKDPARAQLVLKWVDWCYANGGDMARQLEYIPLPKAVQDRVRGTWREQLAFK
jgi:phosphate transport system substrate-binding protein